MADVFRGGLPEEKMEPMSAYERRHPPVDFPEPKRGDKYTDHGVTYQIGVMQQAVTELEEAISNLRDRIAPILYISPEPTADSGEAKNSEAYPLNCGVAMEIEILRHRVVAMNNRVRETIGQVDL